MSQRVPSSVFFAEGWKSAASCAEKRPKPEGCGRCVLIFGAVDGILETISMLTFVVFQNSTKTDANLSLQLLSTLHTILYSMKQFVRHKWKGRADGVRRMQNETECPIGEEFFGAGTVSGGVYPCLFSGDGGTGLLADREPDKSSGRPGRHGPYMGPGPGRGMRTAAAVFV